MEVETYEVTEATTEHREAFEIDAEAQALIEELGLEGQQTLMKRPDPEVDTATRIPYQQMNLEEKAVYKVVFPEKADVAAYDAGPIPLRVLQVAAHAVKLFDDVEVWYPQTNNPDPLLVGILKEGKKTRQFLLARWGDALVPFADLRETARQIVTGQWSKKAREVIAQCEEFLAAPDVEVDRKLAGEWVYKPFTT